MPPKIRELIAELERNGFTNRGGKGKPLKFQASVLFKNCYNYRESGK
jgi:hypothetical protein